MSDNPRFFTKDKVVEVAAGLVKVTKDESGEITKREVDTGNANVAVLFSDANTALKGAVATISGYAAFVSGTTYGKNAIVTYNNELYISIIADNTDLPTVTTSWQKTTIEGVTCEAGLTEVNDGYEATVYGHKFTCDTLPDESQCSVKIDGESVSWSSSSEGWGNTIGEVDYYVYYKEDSSILGAVRNTDGTVLDTGTWSSSTTNIKSIPSWATQEIASTASNKSVTDLSKLFSHPDTSGEPKSVTNLLNNSELEKSVDLVCEAKSLEKVAYTASNAGQALKVNSAGNALEWGDAGGVQPSDLPYGYNSVTPVQKKQSEAVKYAKATAYYAGDYIYRVVDEENVYYVCIADVSESANTSWDNIKASFEQDATTSTATVTDGSINILKASSNGDILSITLPYPVTNKVTSLIVRFNFSDISSDDDLPTVFWYCKDADGNIQTINWDDISGDTAASGKIYWYMVTLYPTGTNAMDGIMSIRELATRS